MPRRFVDQRRRDPYYRAAQRDGLRSRAAFKLLQLAERFPIFREGDRVLDLGAAPGGWSVVARECVGPRGEVVAVDLRSVEPIEGVRFVRGRVGEASVEERLGSEPFDVVLSDMSPAISGAYSADHARSVELARIAFELATRLLRPSGSFVAKVFAGDLLGTLEGPGRDAFASWRRTKPLASRTGSSEMYVIGLEFRGSGKVARAGAPAEAPAGAPGGASGAGRRS